MENEWELLEETFGLPQAELLRSYLEALGIPVLLTQEGAGHALGLTVGTLGRVEVLVPSEKLDDARRAVAAMLPGVSGSEETASAEDAETEEELDALSESTDTSSEPLP